MTRACARLRAVDLALFCSEPLSLAFHLTWPPSSVELETGVQNAAELVNTPKPMTPLGQVTCKPEWEPQIRVSRLCPLPCPVPPSGSKAPSAFWLLGEPQCSVNRCLQGSHGPSGDHVCHKSPEVPQSPAPGSVSSEGKTPLSPPPVAASVCLEEK